MSTKTITITEGAYGRLEAIKDPAESFTDVINRVTKKVRLADFAGLLTQDEAEAARLTIAGLRKRSRERYRRLYDTGQHVSH